MKGFEFSSPEVSDQELDRLADGELSEPEYRDLLTRLEEAFTREDGGPWRRCALALLEAQMLRKEAGEWMAGGPGCEAPSGAPSMANRRLPVGWPALAMACAVGFVAALAFSAFLDGRQGHLPSPSGLAEQHPVQPNEGPESSIAQRGGGEPIEDASSAWLPAGDLTLAVDAADGGSEQRIQVPLYRSASGDTPPVWSLPAAASALVESLESAGHRVTLQRQLWPLKLDDGRQVVVPIDQVVVAPPSAASFQ
jgi:hypothetical protein